MVLIQLFLPLTIVYITHAQCINNTPGTICVIDGGSSSNPTCRSGDPCEINCSMKECIDKTLDAQDATDVNIKCNGEDACKGNVYIICGTGDCLLYCNNDLTSCQDATIVNPNQRAHTFKCFNYCNQLKGDDNTYTQQPTPSPITILYTTISPSKFPSKYPSTQPTQLPTKFPTKLSIQTPTKSPTKSLTNSPTKFPTKSPTKFPTKSPITSENPSKKPTNNPSNKPTHSSGQVEESTVFNPFHTTESPKLIVKNGNNSLNIGYYVIIIFCISIMFFCIAFIIYIITRNRKRKYKNNNIDKYVPLLNKNDFEPVNDESCSSVVNDDTAGIGIFDGIETKGKAVHMEGDKKEKKCINKGLEGINTECDTQWIGMAEEEEYDIDIDNIELQNDNKNNDNNVETIVGNDISDVENEEFVICDDEQTSDIHDDVDDQLELETIQ